MIKSLYAALALVLIPCTAYAGGVVPQGYGMYNDGRTVNVVPANSSLIRWVDYGGNLDTQLRDEITRAATSVDYETLEFRLLYGNTPPDPLPSNYVQVWIRGSSSGVSGECLDGVPGGCVYAVTECLTKFRSGSTDFCKEYRMTLYNSNIQYGSDVRGISFYDFAHSLLRHEFGHVLGLKHEYAGPMTNNATYEFHSCQHLMWNMFHIDAAIPTWTYPALPAECQ